MSQRIIEINNYQLDFRVGFIREFNIKFMDNMVNIFQIQYFKKEFVRIGIYPELSKYSLEDYGKYTPFNLFK